MSNLCVRRLPREKSLTPPKHLDKEFFSKALEEGLRASEVKINSIKLLWGSKPGESYSSEIYRAIIDADICLDATWESLKTSVILKFIPIKYKNDFLKLSKVFLKEKITYCDVLPYLETLSDGDSFAPKCYYTHNDPETMVFEDLKLQGFTTYEYDNQLDFTHSILVIQKLAKFHAASMVLLKKNPALKCRYQKGFCCKDVLIYDTTFSKILQQTLQNLISVCSTWPDFQNITQKLKNFAQRFKEITVHLAVPKSSDRFQVINHGDVWTNNFMFQYSLHRTEIKFVDFQFSFLGSPGCDLNMLFNTSIQLNVLKQREQLIEKYYETFTETLKYLRFKNVPTYDDVIHEIRSRELYGFFYMFAYLPIVQSFSKSVSINSTINTLNDEEKTEQSILLIYQYQHVIAQLKYSLKRFNDLGVLDEY